MNNRLICGIDIGSTNIHAIVGSLNQETGKIEILASEVASSQGIRKGVVVEIEEAREALENILRSLERKSAADIRKVACSVSGKHISSQVSKGVIAVSRANNEVSEQDVQRAIEAAETISLPQNREILHTIPRVFSCDDQQGVDNPVGMKGVRLEVNTLIIEAFSPFIKNLKKIFEGLGVEVEEIIHAPIAASKATLTKRQKELGVVLLDIGAQTTGLAVYEEGKILHSAVLPVGSSHISNDLAIGFQIPVEVAEKLKTKWGTPILNEENRGKSYSLSKIDSKYREKVELKKVSEIVQARLREIFSLVRKELKKIDKNKKLPAGTVLVGEGAKLKNILPYTKEELGLPAQLGEPHQIEGLTDEVKDSGFVTCVGLLLQSKSEKIQNSSLSFLKNTREYLVKIAKNLLP